MRKRQKYGDVSANNNDIQIEYFESKDIDQNNISTIESLHEDKLVPSALKIEVNGATTMLFSIKTKNLK